MRRYKQKPPEYFDRCLAKAGPGLDLAGNLECSTDVTSSFKLPSSFPRLTGRSDECVIDTRKHFQREHCLDPGGSEMVKAAPGGL